MTNSAESKGVRKTYYDPSAECEGIMLKSMYPICPNLLPLLGKVVVCTPTESSNDNVSSEIASTESISKISISKELRSSNKEQLTPLSGKIHSLRSLSDTSTSTKSKSLSASRKKTAIPPPKKDFVRMSRVGAEHTQLRNSDNQTSLHHNADTTTTVTTPPKKRTLPTPKQVRVAIEINSEKSFGIVAKTKAKHVSKKASSTVDKATSDEDEEAVVEKSATKDDDRRPVVATADSDTSFGTVAKTKRTHSSKKTPTPLIREASSPTTMDISTSNENGDAIVENSAANKDRRPVVENSTKTKTKAANLPKKTSTTLARASSTTTTTTTTTMDKTISNEDEDIVVETPVTKDDRRPVVENSTKTTRSKLRRGSSMAADKTKKDDSHPKPEPIQTKPRETTNSGVIQFFDREKINEKRRLIKKAFRSSQSSQTQDTDNAADVATAAEDVPSKRPADNATSQETSDPPSDHVVKRRRVLPKSATATRVKDDGMTGIALSDEQKAVHDLVVQGKKSVFFTGAAGTGKSILLKAIIKSLLLKYAVDEVAITAPTGIAAINIGGETINRFANVGFGDLSVNDYVEKINNNFIKLRSWLQTKVLIIDEISMIDGNLLDLVEQIARHVRKNNLPFGGIQTVFCGDFYQLPPVKSSKLAFQAKCWKKVVKECQMLSKPFRQKDMSFVNILNEVRVGKVSDHTRDTFMSLTRVPTITSEIEPTELYSRKSQVYAANMKKLMLLDGTSHAFRAIDQGDQSILKQCIAPPLLTLKVGAQVMLIKNMSRSLVNGSLGVVTHFSEVQKSIFPVVKFADGTEQTMQPENWDFNVAGIKVASRQQIPLILAWAMSIHKAQGKTIEFVKVDLKEVFESGQAYTALSRATDLRKLQVLNFHDRYIKADPRVTAFQKSLEK